jgi:hypothetical protein
MNNRFIYIVLLTILSSVNAGRTTFGHSAAFAAPSSIRNSVLGQPDYQVASSDLSSQWIQLVKDGKVSATVNIDCNGDKVDVTYGVRLVTRGSKTRCEEFVEEHGLEPGQSSRYEFFQRINSTLTSIQEKEALSPSSSAVQYAVGGDFCAQLQLVRTLRPAPSPGFSGSTTSIPPEYDASTDSFVTGPLRLELRPCVATISVPNMFTPWDVFHNVSPADARGHFLLLPTLTDESKNWRGQVLTKQDCHDLTHLASSVKPTGSLLIGFNSVGAGASQNHIHCHAWPSPPVPLMQGNDDDEERKTKGWDCYAVSKVESIYDFCDIRDGQVEISYLKYPVFCVQLSATEQHLALLGQALATTLDAVGDAPYNIGILNRPQEDEHGNTETPVDVFVFARSKERSDVLPSLKLGISEMMGVFHAQNDAELEELVALSEEEEEGRMARALRDVSHDEEEGLWERIKENLGQLDQAES